MGYISEYRSFSTPPPQHKQQTAFPPMKQGLCTGYYRLLPFSQWIPRRFLSSLSDDVNDVCRILSDFRAPHHDLEPSLRPFAARTSPALADQVLKRCRNLPSSALRYFLWASHLPGFLHSAETHHILLDILGSARQFPLIWTLLSETRDAGNHHNIHPEAFHIIFRAYSRAGLPADALRAFNKMPDFGLSPNLDDLHQLLSSLSRNNLATHAQQFFDKLKQDFPVNQKTYSILIGGWAATGAAKDALNLFDEMLQRGFTPDLIAHNVLMAALCRGGELDEAYKRLHEMRTRHGLEPDASTYALFIRASCSENDLHSTIRMLETMRRHDLVPNVFTYNCVIKLLCENEKMYEAYELLDEVMGKGAQPDVWSYNTILAAHCRVKEVNRALRLLARMDKDGCRPDRHTYNLLLKMLLGCGRFDRVLEVWDGMEGRGFYPWASTYSVMIHGLCRKRGKVEEACGYFEAMVDEGIPPYLSTCELLRSQLWQQGLRDRIFVIADKMRRSTSCTIQELSSVMEGSEEDGWSSGRMRIDHL